MSEVQSRPAASRGRGSGRGGRGGFAARGGSRAGTRPNGDSKHDTDSSLPTLEDEGEIGQLKQKYGSKVELIKEMFPDWSSVDILFALQETDGDESVAVTRMAEGTISQWGEVSKPKKGPKAKADTFTTTTGDSAPAGAFRNARGGRGADTGRGRGRGGAPRGKPAHATTTNGARVKETQPLSVPTEEASEWNTKPAETASAWEQPTATETTPAAAPSTTTAPSTAPASGPKPAVIPQGTKTTWASMLRQTTTPKVAPKPKEAPVKAPEPAVEPVPAAAAAAEPTEPEPVPEAPAPVEEPAVESEKEAAPAPTIETVAPAVPVVPAVPAIPAVAVPEIALVPSKDQLTEQNLDQVKDDSHPPVTETAASEAADSWDPRAAAPSATATPLSASQQQHQAARAAAKPAARTPVHHPRRMLDQLEAVRMPGNRDQVDRAAVQFGAFSLNGPIDDDVDGDREEPETRPQPPEDSPVAHPRTSLPPVQPTPVPDAFPAQKPAASQIPTGPAAAAPSAPQANTPSTAQATIQPPAAQNNQQFGRFGQTAPQESSSFPTSKPFEPFGQQPVVASAAQNQFEGGFQGQGQAAQAAAQQQQPGAAFSSAPADYSSYYTPEQQNRLNYYNQNFGQQQAAQGQQDVATSQPQRSFSGYNAPQSDNLSQYPQSGAQHAQSRFGGSTTADSQTAAAATPGQATSQAQSAASTQAQSHGQQPHDYPYSSHPYYQNPYYSAYMNYQGGYNQGAYGGPYGNKGGLNYQPSQYGVNPQGPHAYSSPAGAFAQSALHRDTAVAGSLGEYGRAASTQSGQQGLGGGFGGVHDAFGRGGSAYQSQGAQSFNAPGSQPGSGPSAADDLKPFGDAKAAGGPSPSLGAAARPGSAANNGPQTGLPPPQSNQQSGLGMGGYGYPGHMQQQQQGHGLHGSQSSAAGYGMGATGAQTHQNTYGAGYAGQGGFTGSYYGNPPRGWGNNYH